MRSIMIDSVNRQFLEVELHNMLAVWKALARPKSQIPVEVTSVDLDLGVTMLYDCNGVLKHPADYFYIDGVSTPIFGNAVVMGLAANEVAAIVAFHAPPKRYVTDRI